MRAGWGDAVYILRMANETARRLRRATTRQEARLWLRLRELRKHGFHFRRQVPIDGFIVDFACYHPKVAIEIDGGQHSYAGHAKRDASRDACLVLSDFKVLRFWNNDVDRNLRGVMRTILLELEHLPPTQAPRMRGACPPRQGEGVG